MKPNSERPSSAEDGLSLAVNKPPASPQDSRPMLTSRSRKVPWVRVKLIGLVVTYVSLLVFVPVIALFPKALENGVEGSGRPLLRAMRFSPCG